MLDLLRRRRRHRDERGASSVEYGLLITGIAAVIAVIVFTFGDNVIDLFDETCDTVNDARQVAECQP
jgi:Flp pilus assembly pilin Flp